MTQSEAIIVLDLVLAAATLVSKLAGLKQDVSDDELAAARARSRVATDKLRETIEGM